jgi:hypothetical protein
MTDAPPHVSPAANGLPWWAYVLMLPLVAPAIIAAGYVINTIAEMGGG